MSEQTKAPVTPADPGALEWPFPYFEQLRAGGTSQFEVPGMALMVFGTVGRGRDQQADGALLDEHHRRAGCAPARA